MIIKEASIKLWSRLGSRATFGLATFELGKTMDNLIVLAGDTSVSGGLDRFRKTYPDKYIEVGIAEQNMIGIAAGLASEGYNVITSTFAPFHTMRCLEQIRVNLGYMRNKVTIVGLASGLVLGNLGFTHCCIEDIGILRTIPGMKIISPADCGETVKALLAAVNVNEPVYIRLTGDINNPIVYNNDYKFEIGKSITLREGGDVTIIATGTMVHKSIEAAKLLSENGISAKIIDMHTIKPLDKEAIKKSCKDSKLIITVEEHNILGGLGSAVAEYKATLGNSPRQIILGVQDRYDKADSHEILLEKNGLTVKQIADRVIKEYNSQ